MWIIAPIQTKRISRVTCDMSPVTYHTSLKLTATDPPPANSPTIHNRMVRKDQKTKCKKRNANNHKNAQKKGVSFFNIINMLLDQKYTALLVLVVKGGDIHT